VIVFLSGEEIDLVGVALLDLAEQPIDEVMPVAIAWVIVPMWIGKDELVHLQHFQLALTPSYVCHGTRAFGMSGCPST
jgi:hypothetical protein